MEQYQLSEKQPAQLAEPETTNRQPSAGEVGSDREMEREVIDALRKQFEAQYYATSLQKKIAARLKNTDRVRQLNDILNEVEVSMAVLDEELQKLG